MTDAIRWLHLSDIHIGKDNYAQVDFLEKVVAHVRTELSNGNVPDFVFVTGDIADRGAKKEYEAFRRNLYEPLIAALGDGWTGTFFTVPGNHDVQRPPSDALDPAKLSSRGSKFFDPTADGKVRRDAQVIPRFNNYKKLVPSGATNDWVATKDGAFAEEVLVRGRRIGVVGINTAWLAMGEKDQGMLTPGLPLVEAALTKVKKADICIVMGHHPIDWLIAEQQPPLRSLFGEYGVVYLHGHMHKVDGRPEDGAGQGYLVVQAGAAFQTRVDDSVYKNGLLWGELDLKSRQLRLSPRVYNADNRDWPTEAGRFPEIRKVPDRADWWEFPLPSPDSPSKMGWQAPKGWNVMTAATFASLRREITSAEAEQYFDGAEPEWTTVLSPKLPKRHIVARVAQRFLTYSSTERPLVFLLTGPSGEGKSTATRQIVVHLAEQGWRIVWRQDVEASLSLDEIQAISQEGGRWLIATDSADLQVSSLHQAAVKLTKGPHSEVHFLLCSRGSDWNVTGANLDWGRLTFESETLSGLDSNDAKLIATSWQDFGASNQTVSIEILAKQLIDAARNEATLGEGALLGGVLVMRRGAAGLRAHVYGLLKRLHQTQLKESKTLRDATAYISAMHAKNLDFLSRPVLASVLGYASVGELNNRVLQPLGREAVASGGTFLRTRHRRIASEVIAILHDELGLEMEDYLLELATAAVTLRATTFIPQFSKWEFQLPECLLLEGNFEAAIRIARALVELDPTNAQRAVHLGHIYREAGEAAQGAEMLEKMVAEPNRAYWHEWATCAGVGGNPTLSAWLDGYSLADHPDLPPPDNERAKQSLVGLGFAFRKLYENYNDDVFKNALTVIVQFGDLLRVDEKSKSYFEGFRRDVQTLRGRPAESLAEALGILKNALQRAWDCCADRDRLVGLLQAPLNMRFADLERLCSALEKMSEARIWNLPATQVDLIGKD